jgi:ADP-ribose pyrophosphatase YjhB (NUDIX family)
MDIPADIYQTVVRTMPIACVDLIVFNSAREVLLVRRTNAPARGQWWFPGGRVHYGETRQAAVRRQLLKECGLEAGTVNELWTLDVILPLDSATHVSHGITTLYAVTAKPPARVVLDDQASEFAWRESPAWQSEALHPIVRQVLREIDNNKAAGTEMMPSA